MLFGKCRFLFAICFLLIHQITAKSFDDKNFIETNDLIELGFQFSNSTVERVNFSADFKIGIFSIFVYHDSTSDFEKFQVGYNIEKKLGVKEADSLKTKALEVFSRISLTNFYFKKNDYSQQRFWLFIKTKSCKSYFSGMVYQADPTIIDLILDLERYINDTMVSNKNNRSSIKVFPILSEQ